MVSEISQTGVYGDCVLYQSQIIFKGLKVTEVSHRVTIANESTFTLKTSGTLTIDVGQSSPKILF